MPEPSPYAAVAQLDELSEGTPVRVETPSGPLCLVRNGDEVHAFSDSCPHRGNPLSEGTVSDGVIRCRLHEWQFDMASGDAVHPKAPFGLEIKPCRVTEGQVEVTV